MIYLSAFAILALTLKLFLAFDFISLILLIFLTIVAICIYKRASSMFLIPFFIGLALAFSIDKSTSGEVSTNLIVIKASDNYVLARNLFSTYYISAKGHSFEIGDIINVTGSLSKLEFSHKEQGFDLINYYRSYSCYAELNAQSITLVFHNFIRMREFANYLFKNYNEEAKSLAKSLIFHTSIDSQLYSSLQEIGIVHLIATSSFHIAFLNQVITSFLDKNSRSKYGHLIPLITSFSLLILSSYNFSIQRIFLMNGLAALNKLLKKFPYLNYLERLSISGIIILFFQPSYILNTGFYFIYIPCTFSYLLGNRLSKRSRYKQVKRSLIFFVCLLPINAYYNCGFNVLSTFLQLLFAPIFSSIFVLNFTCFIPGLGKFILNPTNTFIYLTLTRIAEIKIFISTGELSAWLIFLIYLSYLCFLYFDEIKLKLISHKIILFPVIVLAISICPRIIPRYEVYFIDVNQGDSTLIINGNQNVLIDTGGSVYEDMAKECLLPFFRSKKIYSLDAVILTHSDFDHSGALASLKENFPVKETYYGPDFQTINVGNLKFDNLNRYYNNYSESNEKSAVLSFKIKNSSFLITGDAPTSIEKDILNSGKLGKVNYLKLGHHGSSDSSSLDFLKATNPDLAIISCGLNNMYHHPSYEVIQRLEDLNIPYKRTDYDGTIKIKL